MNKKQTVKKNFQKILAHRLSREGGLTVFGIPGRGRVGVAVAKSVKGAVRERFDLSLGGCGVNGTTASAQLLQQADLVLCVGTRLTDFTTGSQSIFGNPNVGFIGINVYGRDATMISMLRNLKGRDMESVIAHAQPSYVRPKGEIPQGVAFNDNGFSNGPINSGPPSFFARLFGAPPPPPPPQYLERRRRIFSR